MEAFVAGLIAGYGIAIPVGAIAVLIVQVGIKCGFRCGLSAGAGAATADGAYATLAVIGGVALTQFVETIGTPLRVVSALVLVVIAVYGLRRARTPVQPVAFTYPNRTELATTYARFLGLTIINPTTIVYFAAVVVGLGVASDMSAGAGVMFVLGAFIASLSWQALLAAVGAFAGRWLTPRAQRAAVVVGNIMILALAVIILLP
jgi:arginine exporter protein ArgO